jgi:hypothetical protein
MPHGLIRDGSASGVGSGGGDSGDSGFSSVEEVASFREGQSVTGCEEDEAGAPLLAEMATHAARWLDLSVKLGVQDMAEGGDTRAQIALGNILHARYYYLTPESERPYIVRHMKCAGILRDKIVVDRQGSLETSHEGAARAMDVLSTAVHWFQQAALSGCAEAQLRLGLCYLNPFCRDIIGHDRPKAFSCMQLAGMSIDL